MKKKTGNDFLIQELKQKIGKIPIEELYEVLKGLNDTRVQNVINSLMPEKFSELATFERTKPFLCSELWPLKIAKNLLDALSPIDLIYIGHKHSAGTVTWGKWEYSQYQEKFCQNLADYFFFCEENRLFEIVGFLINSTYGVTAPDSERDFDIFKYKEGEQFPFEVVKIFHVVHPKKLFSVFNKLSAEDFKRTLWLSEKMCNYEEHIENVFMDEYGKDASFDTDYEIIKAIAKNTHLIENKKLYLLLLQFSEDYQNFITTALGKKRILQMKKEKNFSRSIATPFCLFVDKEPNELVLEKLKAGETTVKRLSTKKSVELLGELSTSG